MPILSYKSGKFVFTEDRKLRKGLLPSHTGKWETGRVSGTWVTDDFNAIAPLRDYADESAQNLINRAFVKFYPFDEGLLPTFLDAHQKKGVTWIMTRSRSYLAHAPGAGKTCEALVAGMLARERETRDGGRGTLVFIVPPTLTANWAREAYHFFHLYMGMSNSPFRSPTAWPSIAVIPETQRQANAGWRADFLIVPDSMLTKPWVMEGLHGLKRISLLAVDEASRFKECTSQRSLALYGGYLHGRSTPGLVGKAHHVVLLDGSPMPNRPMELWAPTYALAPESIDFMHRSDFGFRYCGAKVDERGQWTFDHSSHEEELRSRLQESFMHVVTEEELDHPERKRSLLYMSDDVRSLEQKSWERKNLAQIDFDSLLEKGDDASQGDLARYRAELGMRKVPWTVQYVKDHMDKNESILLFAWHRDVVLELSQKLAKYWPGIVMGGTLESIREQYFKEFQAGTRKLLIMNIIAGGRGHNLQAATRAIFHEWSWSDETNKQCEKRISRRGNTKAFVPSDYIVCPNSMDEPVLTSVFRKQSRVKRIIG